MSLSSVVIVGAGLCGSRAALELRQLGYEGPVTLIGDEIHLPYDRPPLSKQLGTEITHLAAREHYADANIELRQGVAVTGIDRTHKTVSFADGSILPYGNLLLATGARSGMISDWAGLDHVHTLRTFDNALAIRQRLRPGARLVVIGGGFIGLELAAMANQLGAVVTVIEGQSRLMARGVPAEIASIVERRHREAGVTIMLNQGVSTIASVEGVVVTLDDGRRIEGDFAVVGVGSVPNVELAQQAGLDIANGIAVDETLTTVDCRLELTRGCH